MNTTLLKQLKKSLLHGINKHNFDDQDRTKDYQFSVSLESDDKEYPYADIIVQPHFKFDDMDEVWKIEEIEVVKLEVYNDIGEIEYIDELEIGGYLTSQLAEL